MYRCAICGETLGTPQSRNHTYGCPEMESQARALQRRRMMAIAGKEPSCVPCPPPEPPSLAAQVELSALRIRELEAERDALKERVAELERQLSALSEAHGRCNEWLIARDERIAALEDEFAEEMT